MNDGQKRTSWILLGAVALAAAIAVFVLTLERPSPAPPPIESGRARALAPATDPTTQPLDSQRTPDGAVAPKPASDSAQAPIDPKERAISGDVRTISGQAVAGAEVRLALVEPEEAHDVGAAKCDEHGLFRVSAKPLEELDTSRLALAELVATAHAPGFQSQKQIINLRLLSFEGAAPLVFHFALKPGNLLRGRIVDRSGAPVRGAEIELLVPGAGKAEVHAVRNVFSRDRTGSDGRFVLSFVSGGSYQLAAREANTGTAFDEKLVLAAGDDRDLGDVVLHGDGVLAGKARYPGGAPARALELWAVPDWMANEATPTATAALKAPELERNDGLLYGRTTSDAAGRFRFGGLKPGNYALFSPRPEVVIEPHQARYPLGTENITIEVQSYRLLVHVKDASGRPMPGVGVACAEMSLVQDGRLETVKVEHRQATGADATAAFEIDADRTFALTAASQGSRAAEELVICAPGEYEIERNLVMQPSGAKGRLHLTLEGAGSRSVSALDISFFSALTEQRSEEIGVVSPDADGWLPPLPPGRYRLQVGFGVRGGELALSFPIATRDEVEIRAGSSTEHVVRARPGARVRLTLNDGGKSAAQAPSTSGAGSEKQRDRDLRARGAAVTAACGPNGEKRAVQFVRPAPEQPQQLTLDSALLPGDTALIADLLEPGECTLHVEVPGFQSADARVSLRPGAIEDVRIDLVRK